MNPIKNKKDLEATIDEIRNFAYSYLEKYNPSKQQLRTYLFKKLIKVKQSFLDNFFLNHYMKILNSLFGVKQGLKLFTWNGLRS